MQLDTAPASFKGPLPGKYQDISRAELFAVMKLMVSVTNFNVQWYSDSKYAIEGILHLLENPIKDASNQGMKGKRSNEDMWAIAAEIVGWFKRFFTIDCKYVPAHIEADEVGSVITSFELLGNEAADKAAKK